AGPTVDVTAETISKRRTARDKARAFVGSTVDAARRSKVGQQVAKAVDTAASSQFAENMSRNAKRIGENLSGLKQSAQMFPGGIPGVAAFHGSAGTIGYALGRQQGYSNSNVPGVLPTLAATALGGPAAGIGYAVGRYQGRKNAQQNQVNMVNPAIQSPLY
ncbi:hypothetical protein EBT25_07085, partial [bacterium]|nr:hypothetical protein [bacterium]